MRDSWSLIVLGDLHMEDDMTAHNQARADCVAALRKFSLVPTPTNDDMTVQETLKDLEEKRAGDLSVSEFEMLRHYRSYGDLANCYLVCLGDLGRKDIRHEPGDAGTTKSFLDAKDFLDGFGVPFELVTGNHDLEGLDEFDTDEKNLQVWMDCFNKETPQSSRQIGERTLLLALSSVRFRDAPYSSHEIDVGDDQLEWFIRTVREHPAEEGWKILVFSHAPIIGSGLRVLENVHVRNGCAWLNHSSANRNTFMRVVKESPQIKLWFSGHFHLSHDHEDAISTVGSCTFVQAGVIGPISTLDGCRQTRLVQGCKDYLRIFTINHHIRDEEGQAQIRLDAEIDVMKGTAGLLEYNQERGPSWPRAFGRFPRASLSLVLPLYSPFLCSMCFIELVPREEDR